MFIVLPVVWLILWVVIAGVVGVFSGVAPQSGGLMVFLVTFLCGCFGLPIIGGAGWLAWNRIRQRH